MTHNHVKVLTGLFSLRLLIIKVAIILMLINLFCTTFRYGLVNAGITGETDVVVHIDVLLVKTGGWDWDGSGADPFVLGEVDYTPYPGTWGTSGSTKNDDDVAAGNYATKLQCKAYMILKFAVISDGNIKIKLLVIDYDPDILGYKGWGDKMLNSGWKSVPYSGPGGNGTLVVENDNVWLRITYYFFKACRGNKDYCHASVYRDTQNHFVQPKQLFDIQLALDVNETFVPENVTIIDRIPPGFAYLGASLDPTFLHEIIDGVDLTYLRWELTGTEVLDRNITYTLLAPDVSGITFGLAGEAISENRSFAILGEPSIEVSKTVGGIVVPVDKFGLLAPYIGLASTIMVAAIATTVYVKRVKHRKDKK